MRSLTVCRKTNIERHASVHVVTVRPNPAFNTDRKRRSYARADAAGYLVSLAAG